MTDWIERHLDEGVLTLRLTRGDKKNALTHAMYQGLNAAFAEAAGSCAVRVILLHGDDNFCAGNDLGDFLKNPPSSADAPVFCFLNHLLNAEKPLVAAINGVAVGIGTTLALHCDLVFAGDNARFQLPFVNLGLVPEAASSYLLPQLIGHARAAELLLLGGAFDAKRALELGLINSLCPAETTVATALDAARRLAAQPAESVRLTKALMKAPHRARAEQAMADEAAHFLNQLNSAEAKRAFTAFFEKRNASTRSAD